MRTKPHLTSRSTPGIRHGSSEAASVADERHALNATAASNEAREATNTFILVMLNSAPNDSNERFAEFVMSSSGWRSCAAYVVGH